MTAGAFQVREGLRRAAKTVRSWTDFAKPELHGEPTFAAARHLGALLIVLIVTMTWMLNGRDMAALGLAVPNADSSDPTAPFRGLGTWVDVFDWSFSATGGHPTVTPADIDVMAVRGVQTIYLQASRHSAPEAILEPAVLNRFIERARKDHIHIVLWYAPTLVDVTQERRRIDAMGALDPDGVVVDAESRDIADPAERSRRLVALMSGVRATNPGLPIGIAIQPPVLTEVVNPDFWPAFPYSEINAVVDVWMPMTYWSERRASSPYRAPYRYVTDSITRLRADVGTKNEIVVHAIGGVADSINAQQLSDYMRGVKDSNAVGASLYDWRTTPQALWSLLNERRAK